MIRNVSAGLMVLLIGTRIVCAADEEVVHYSRHVAPVLRTYCVGCHNRVEAEAGLSLQRPEDIERGAASGQVLNADAPEDSLLLKVVMSDGDDHMPPLDAPQPSSEERRLLIRWLRSGAAFDSRLAVLPDLPQIQVRTGHVRAPALTMRLSSDGSRLFLGRFRVVEQRDAGTGELIWSFPVPDGKVNSVRPASDGTQLLLATGTPGLSGRAVRVAPGSDVVLREYGGHDDILYAAEWSPDGKLIATAGYDRKIVLHDAESGEFIRELSGHNGAVFDLKFSPDGSLLASASADATVKIWHVDTGERLDTLSQPQAEQYAVAFTPDGRFIFSAGADSRIRKWQMLSLRSPRINPILVSRFAHEGAITRMELSGNGRYLVTAAENGSVKVWNAETVEELSAEWLEGDMVTGMSFQADDAAVLITTAKEKQLSIGMPAAVSDTTLIAVRPATPMTAGQSQLLIEVDEAEPNDSVEHAQHVTWPVRISGTIDGGTTEQSDADVFRFDAKKGEPVMVEVLAARDKSPLDSIVEILDSEGLPVLQVQLQAVRDSYFTFRGKDSDTSDDFRVFNWQEMELNEYLYADGEVVKLWLYPRGPDSGFKVYPGFGQRQTYFGTTPSAHPLQGPAFTVVPYSADAVLKDTGLPVFPVYYENDDDPMRQWGKDSRLIFYPPADGIWNVRIRDARGFQGADYHYKLLLRAPRPDFSISMGGNELTIHRGTGRELTFTATRLDGFEGPVEIHAENLPAGFVLSEPIEIQSEQRQAFATLIAADDAVQPSDDDVAAIRFVAKAQIGEQVVVHEISGLKTLKLADSPKIIVRIHTEDQQSAGQQEHTPELTVWAGETVRAFLRVERRNHDGLVEFGKEDSGRNMPHGVFIDNIGLNGLMLLSGQTEREFFITTAGWVPETSRPFYLKSTVDGGITSLPVMLHVRRRPDSSGSATTVAR